MNRKDFLKTFVIGGAALSIPIKLLKEGTPALDVNNLEPVISVAKQVFSKERVDKTSEKYVYLLRALRENNTPTLEIKELHHTLLKALASDIRDEGTFLTREQKSILANFKDNA